jgi:hypothetical protein
VRFPLLTAALLVFAIDARAADPSTREADHLFEEGRSLMDKGSLDAACPKLERSFQLAPRLGTMLNLGGCLERSGRLARAMAIYERAATMAREAGRPDREKAARELAASLEPRVSKLLVIIDDSSQGLVIEVDGEAISTRGGLVPIDPGERHLNARAPGKIPWSVTVNAQAGSTVRINVAALREAPPEVKAEPPPAPPPSRGVDLRTVGIIGGLGVTAVGATLGTVFALQAKSKNDEAGPHCDARGCDPTGKTLTDDALSAGNVATGAFIGAGVGLAITAAFLFVVPSAKTSVALAPTQGGSSLSFRARF